MLEQLLQLVEQSAKEPIIENKAIPDQLNHPAIKEVTNQIISNLKGQVAAGNMQQVIALFQSGGGKSVAANPVVTTMVTSVTAGLSTRFNLPPQVAQNVASNLIPPVINQVIRKANDPRDIDFDLQQMMRSMTGNNSLDISSMMSTPPKGPIGNIFGKIFGK